MMRLNRKGFTLVEIMIVVAIIALLAAIAVPNVLRARHNANEGAASASIKTIVTQANGFYGVQTPKRWPGYNAPVGVLAPAVRTGTTPFGELVGASPPYIGSKFAGANPTVQGYQYNYAMVAPAVGVAANAVPMICCRPTGYHVSGTRTFAHWVYTGETRAIDDAACPYIITEAAYLLMTPLD